MTWFVCECCLKSEMCLFPFFLSGFNQGQGGGFDGQGGFNSPGGFGTPQPAEERKVSAFLE